MPEHRRRPVTDGHSKLLRWVQRYADVAVADEKTGASGSRFVMASDRSTSSITRTRMRRGAASTPAPNAAGDRIDLMNDVEPLGFGPLLLFVGVGSARPIGTRRRRLLPRGTLT
jgi:hypothetical protein